MENLLQDSWPLNLQFVVKRLIYAIKKKPLNRDRVWPCLNIFYCILNITPFPAWQSGGMRLQDTGEMLHEVCLLQTKLTDSDDNEMRGQCISRKKLHIKDGEVKRIPNYRKSYAHWLALLIFLNIFQFVEFISELTNIALSLTTCAVIVPVALPVEVALHYMQMMPWFINYSEINNSDIMLASMELVQVRCEPAGEKRNENWGRGKGFFRAFLKSDTFCCVYHAGDIWFSFWNVFLMDISCSFVLNVAVLLWIEINFIIQIT